MFDISPESQRNAEGPKKVVVDGVFVQSKFLTAHIAVDEYCQRQTAAHKVKLPIRFAKIRPGGDSG